jgi:hypothetical protein
MSAPMTCGRLSALIVWLRVCGRSRKRLWEQHQMSRELIMWHRALLHWHQQWLVGILYLLYQGSACDQPASAAISCNQLESAWISLHIPCIPVYRFSALLSTGRALESEIKAGCEKKLSRHALEYSMSLMIVLDHCNFEFKFKFFSRDWFRTRARISKCQLFMINSYAYSAAVTWSGSVRIRILIRIHCSNINI